MEKGEKMFFKVFKRAFDVLVSAIGLLFLFPIFIIIAILMKFQEPGATIFFSQERNGLEGKKFKMYKFRSMYIDAEERLINDKELYRKYVENGYKLNENEDPRITKYGAFLRKTSLDELPQLFNVLKGDMSIIGPRPIPDREIIEYGDRKSKFLSMRPGVTGWWQVSGRSNIGYPERCDLELEYVDNASFKLDSYIFFKTFVTVFKREGAY